MVSPAVDRFARNGMLVAGGARAILLQVAEPVIAAGVARHSDFAHRPLDRLRNTLTFAYAVVIGTPAQSTRAVGFVNRAHVPVEGAADAERQLWVAATLYDTAVAVNERLYGPLDGALAEQILHEYSRLGTSLQVPAELWPATVAEFRTYWDARLATLQVTDHARGVAHDLFAPATAPLWLRAGLPLARLVTIDLLTPELRAAYGYSWGAARQRRARAAWTVIRLVSRIAPRRVREWPARHLLARL